MSAPLRSSSPTPAPDDKELRNYVISLKMRNESKWENKVCPQLVFNAKYVPYAALRQQLWRCLLSQYDTHDNGRLTQVELATMLYSLESTLSEHTINGFFQRFQQTSDQEYADDAGELTIDQAVICLEDRLSQRTKPSTNMPHSACSDVDDQAAIGVPGEAASINLSQLSLSSLGFESTGDDSGLTDLDDKTEERVAMITECPLCHQPRLNKRSEVDIITHVAICASQDWRQIDRFVMSGFVTSDQAHRKWYSKVS
jgi:phosphatidylserine decarboxylase